MMKFPKLLQHITYHPNKTLHLRYMGAAEFEGRVVADAAQRMKGHLPSAPVAFQCPTWHLPTPAPQAWYVGPADCLDTAISLFDLLIHNPARHVPDRGLFLKEESWLRQTYAWMDLAATMEEFTKRWEPVQELYLPLGDIRRLLGNENGMVVGWWALDPVVPWAFFITEAIARQWIEETAQ